MGIFNKLFGKTNVQQSKQSEMEAAPEHAVIVRFNYGIQGLDPLHQLEARLEEVITAGNFGEYDGNEIAIDYSDGLLYMYGPNAEILFKAIKPTLESCDFMKGASVKLRFGPPSDDTKELEVTI
jgi:hypothetical protein